MRNVLVPSIKKIHDVINTYLSYNFNCAEKKFTKYNNLLNQVLFSGVKLSIIHMKNMIFSQVHYLENTALIIRNSGKLFKK